MNRLIFCLACVGFALAGLAGCGGRESPGSAPSTTTASKPSDAARRILYYRNPMGLADTSPVPKKDAMGMDYVAVYADEQQADGRVAIGAGRLQKLGVRTELAAPATLERALALAGTLQADESRQWTVSARFDGWIEELYVATTGARVRRGDPLAAAYVPEALAALDEARIATTMRGAVAAADAETRARADALVAGSAARLHNWGISESDFRTTPGGRTLLILRAAHDGIVIEKNARVGMRFVAGDSLYQLADLGRVWLIAAAFEQDLGLLRPGMTTIASVPSYPGRNFNGKVAFISPVLQPETRTAQVRIALDNADGALKPSMYASVTVQAGISQRALTVHDSAILDTGTRRLVIVDRGAGVFEPRAVVTGARGGGRTEILQGLNDHESVVVNGNFLIDAESNLKAVIDGMGHDVGASSEKRP